MLLKSRRVESMGASALLVGMATSLLDGFSFPGVPLEQPVSLTVSDGEPVVAWCGDDIELKSIGIYYGTISDPNDAALAFEGSGSQKVSAGDYIFPIKNSSSWISQTTPPSTTKVSEIIVSLSGVLTDSGDTSTDSHVYAKFDLGAIDELGDWPDGMWQRGNSAPGELVDEPCGG